MDTRRALSQDPEADCGDAWVEGWSGTSESTASRHEQRLSALVTPALECYPSIHSHSLSLSLPKLSLPNDHSFVAPTPSLHIRQNSIIVKNVNQTYSHLLSILERSDDTKSLAEECDLPEEYSASVEDTVTQYAGTSPTAPATDSDCGDMGETPVQRFKYEKEIHFMARRRLSVPSFGLLPTRTFCDSCNMDVSTRVSMELPRISVWRTLGLLSDMFFCWKEPDALAKYQEILHYCRRCRKLLVRVSPAN